MPFGGSTYDPAKDKARLNKQCAAVWRHLLANPGWHTLAELNAATGYPEASISARLRDFRKKEFGEHSVLRRRRGVPTDGLWEYRLVPNYGEVFQ